MGEYLDEARQELKRVDHICYVSLKYTRTVDVIKAAISRLIAAFDFAFNELIVKFEGESNIKKFLTPGQKLAFLREKLASNAKMMEYLDFYVMLRKINRMNYTKREEYRRHVTMIVEMPEGKVEVDIDILKEYYNKTKGFLEEIELPK